MCNRVTLLRMATALLATVGAVPKVCTPVPPPAIFRAAWALVAKPAARTATDNRLVPRLARKANVSGISPATIKIANTVRIGIPPIRSTCSEGLIVCRAFGDPMLNWVSCA